MLAISFICESYKAYPPQRAPHFRQEMASEDHERYIASLLKDISILESQTENVYAHEAVRAKLLQTTKRLVSALEKPGDAVFHNAFLVSKYLSFPRVELACYLS